MNFSQNKTLKWDYPVLFNTKNFKIYLNICTILPLALPDIQKLVQLTDINLTDTSPFLKKMAYVT